MTEQTPLSAAEMREAFEAARAKAREELGSTGAAAILQHLSETVSALQSNNANLAVIARANSHSNAYDMMYTVSGHNGGTIEAYGYLKFGETSHLWAIASKHGQTDVQRLYLSKNNVVEEGGRDTPDNGKSHTNKLIPGECYDFAEDPEALQKLQKRLIRLCADNECVLENDRGNVFNKEAPEPMQKSPVKFRL